MTMMAIQLQHQFPQWQIADLFRRTQSSDQTESPTNATNNNSTTLSLATMQISPKLLLLVFLSPRANAFVAPHPRGSNGAVVTAENSNEHNSLVVESVAPSARNNVAKAFVGALAALSFSFSPLPSTLQGSSSLFALPAHAESARVIGQIKGSGLVFKDTLQVEAFQDPKVKGVYLYVSNFQIPITERLGGNFFNDPSYASVACARTGKVAIASNIAKGPAGEEVFEESKSLLFKTLRVQRIFDEESNTVVYVSFNTRLDKNEDSNKSRFKSSLCAINLDNEGAVSPPTPASNAVAVPVSL